MYPPKFSKPFAMRSTTEFDGVLLVDKSPGMTSHDVVAIARRALNTKKIGHCGTLDPLATGLLILTIGRGTKIQDLLMSEDKEYVGTMRLGLTTSTFDIEGEEIARSDVATLAPGALEAAFAQFRGDFYQMPPMVSAIKKDGVPLYKLARQGKEIEREPRFVHVYASEILRVQLPEVDFRIVCSKGFYVRSFAHDIGQAVGTGGCLSALRRTRSGKFSVEGAVPANDLKSLPRESLAAKVLSLPAVSRLRGA